MTRGGGVTGKRGSRNQDGNVTEMKKVSRNQNDNVTPSRKKNRECHRGDKIKATVLPIVQRKVVKSSRHVGFWAIGVLRWQSTG